MALNLQLLTVQILTNDVQMLILCLSYFITTVQKKSELISDKDKVATDTKMPHIFSSIVSVLR